jgi:hypothetical protein
MARAKYVDLVFISSSPIETSVVESQFDLAVDWWSTAFGLCFSVTPFPSRDGAPDTYSRLEQNGWLCRHANSIAGESTEISR